MKNLILNTILGLLIGTGIGMAIEQHSTDDGDDRDDSVIVDYAPMAIRYGDVITDDGDVIDCDDQDAWGDDDFSEYCD